MIFADWILCGGMLVPIGHWVSRPWMMPRLREQIQVRTEYLKLYEVSEMHRFHALYGGTEQFVTSSSPGKRITLSEEPNPAKTQILKTQTEAQEFGISRNIQWTKPLKSFPVTVRTYGFPLGYAYHSKTGMIARHSETLLQDIWRLQRGACHAVAGVSLTVVAVSWLFYGMNPSPDTQPFLFGLVRNWLT